MNPLSETRLIDNQLLESVKTSRKLEFDNEKAFITWLKSEKNQLKWLDHDTYHRKRDQKVEPLTLLMTI